MSESRVAGRLLPQLTSFAESDAIQAPSGDPLRTAIAIADVLLRGDHAREHEGESRAPLHDGAAPHGAIPARELVSRRGRRRAGDVARARASKAAAPPSLRARLSAALPASRFQYGWQRDRILDRAADFERNVLRITRSPGEMRRLRTAMGGNFAPDAAIEFHGVASHFGPEGLQAHARDRRGQLHVFVRASDGSWVSRPDLAALARAGRIPSADPGRLHGGASTATFAIARPGPGGYGFTIPNLANFDHTPRLRPFQVGDTVQVRRATGNPDTRVEGQAYVPADVTEFGRIVSTDGRGNWTVQLTNADGTPKRDARGQPITRVVTDAQLRATNNPNVLERGDRIHSDARFDPTDASQRQMQAAWRAAPAYRELMRTRPAANAPAAQLAAWQERYARAVVAFCNERMHYPAASDAERTAWRTRIAAIDTEIRDLGRYSGIFGAVAAVRIAQLQGERGGLQAQLDSAQRDNRELDTVRGRIRTTRAELAAAQAAGQPTAEIATRLRNLNQQAQTLAARIEADRRFHANLQSGRNPPPSIGEYFTNGTAQCRHFALVAQALLQEAGIDSRMVRGAANTASGVYRGEHMWLEVTLPGGRQLLVDPTWDSVDDLRRTYDRTPTRRVVPPETEQRWPAGYRDSLASAGLLHLEVA